MDSALLSPAKLNLSLHIVGTQTNGYHLLESYFHKISLSDVVYFEDRDSGIEIRTIGPFRKIPTNAENICYKAAQLLQRKYKICRGIKITLEKNIPQGAGLGGGSSNAAQVLLFLNNHWNLNISSQELENISASLGADVPFFIQSSPCAFVEGLGEVCTPCISPFGKDTALLLFQMKYIQIHTGWAYSQFDSFSDRCGQKCNKSSIDILGDFDSLSQSQKSLLLGNDFEQVIFRFFPDLIFLKKYLLASGAQYASMTGSGSVVYGIFEKKCYAERALEKIRFQGWSYITTFL